MRIANGAYGENEFKYGFLFTHLGQMYSMIGDYSAAETMLQSSLAAQKKITDSDPLDRAILMSSLAQAYTKQRKLAEAEPLVIQSVEAIQLSCSSSPIPCALVRSNLGDYYVVKGQWGMAEVEFKRALELREGALGESALVADSMLSLSRVLRKLKRKGEAKMYEARATQIWSGQKNPVYDGGDTIDVKAFQARNR